MAIGPEDPGPGGTSGLEDSVRDGDLGPDLDLAGPVPVETRSEARRLASGPVLEPIPFVGTDRPDVPVTTGLTPGELDGRAMAAATLAPAHYPAHSRELVEVALAQGQTSLAGLLRALPERSTFVNFEQVWQALGGGLEHADHRPARGQGADQEG